MVLLSLLGTPCLTENGRDIFKLPKLALVLAARLALQDRRPLERLDAAVFLWPDSDVEPAQNKLRQMLYTVRSKEAETGINVFEVTSDRVTLDARLRVDLTGAATAWQGLDSAGIERLVRNKDYVLLNGVRSCQAPLQDWLEHEREYWRSKALAWLRATASGFPAKERASALGQLMGLDPCEESLFRDFIEALARSGQTSKIGAEWEHFQSVLARDVSSEPEPLTVQTVRRLLPAAAGFAEPAQTCRPGGLTGAPRVLVLPPDVAEVDAHMAEKAVAVSLVDDVIDALATLRSFATYAPHTARRVVTDRSLLDNIEADYVFETRLRPPLTAGAERRLSVRLVGANDGEVLFADTLSLGAESLPFRSAQFAAVVAASVATSIERQQIRDLDLGGSPTAYAYYLLAKERLRQFDLKSIRATKSALGRALADSPDHLPSKSLLSRIITNEWFVLAREEKDLLHQAITLSNEVIDAAPMYAMGHLGLSEALIYLGDIDRAVGSAETSRNCASHNANILVSHADSLVHSGDYRRAANEMELALELNPLAPDRYHFIKAGADFMLEEYSRALAHLDEVKQSMPAARLRSVCYAMMDEPREAARWRRVYLRDYPDFRIENWAKVVPLRRPESRAFYIHALRKAGFN